MAGEGTKRIIDLTEAAETQSGDYIAIDSTGRGTRKLPAGFMATAEDLSAEETARQTADATLDGKITAEAQARLDADNALGEQITALDEKTEADAALIQNPTKTLSGALVSFTDGADMPMVACRAEIVPKQSGSGTPSPDNVRPISGWESVDSIVSDEQLYIPSATVIGKNWIGGDASNRAINSFSVEPNTDYRVITKGGNFSNMLFIQMNNSSQINSQTIKPYFQWTITTAENCNRVIIQFESDGDMSESNFLGFVCSVAKTSTLHTTDLGRTVYGGTLDVVSGVLTVTHVYQLFNGSEVWDKMNTSARQTWRSYLATGLDYAGGEMITNEIEVARTSEGSDPDKLTCRGTNYTSRSFYIFAPLSMFATVDDLKTWLASNPLQVCYELATPQTYQLTPTEIQTLLGENNVWADSGDVEITYRRDISIVINNLESALNG